MTLRSTFRTSLAVFLLHTRKVKLSRFANLEACKESAAHVQLHHACHRLHFGDVLPTIGGTRGDRSADADSLQLSRFDRGSRLQ